MSAPTLPELQAWFLTVMTAPGGVAQGQALAATASSLQLDALVAHQRNIAPATRMHVYAQGYVLRLLECLRADYPWLHRVMGEELFSFFARAYLWHYPSRSPTLYDLGARFADFLAESQARQPNDDGLLDLPVALARLERARSEAGRAVGLEQALASTNDADPLVTLLTGRHMQYHAPHCLRLLEIELALLPFVQALAQDQGVPPTPPRERCWIAVTRQHYRVRMHALASWQYQCLMLLTQQPGRTMSASACACALAQERGDSVDTMLAELLVWVPAACAGGLLSTQTAT